MFAKRQLAILVGAAALLIGGQASAGQILLDENFNDVTGVTTNVLIRTVADIQTNNASQLDGATTRVVSGDATEASFNVRRHDNAIDANGANGFDNFFPTPNTNRFLVIGDDDGNINAGTPTTPTAGSMTLTFALDPITVVSVGGIVVSFDYVFDATVAANVDDFSVDLVLADASVVNVLSISDPTGMTRQTGFSATIPYATLSSNPAFLRFKLDEINDANGNSAVGLDNLKVSVVPEPSVLALLGFGLVGLAASRRRKQ